MVTKKHVSSATLSLPAAALLLALTVPSCTTVDPSKAKAQTVVAGLTVHESPEALTGKLLFLVSTNQAVAQHSRGEEPASIYECDLPDMALRKVASAPSGGFVPSQQGDSFCVTWMDRGPVERPYAMKAWGYSRRAQRASTTTLYTDVSAYGPGCSTVVGEDAFFRLWSTVTNGDKILRYCLRSGTKEFLVMPEGSAWQYEAFEEQHAAEDSTNVLHFKYHRMGPRLGAGVDYPEGWYGFDVLTGQIVPVECAESLYQFRGADGRYVFFVGSGAPIEGYKLVSSPADSYDTKEGDVDAKRVRVLTRFSRFGTGSYCLKALSPCKRHALVCKMEPFENAGGGGYTKTYYVVNLATGRTSVLLKDEVGKNTGGWVSQVYWVR